MSSFTYGVGLNNVGSYQVSGRPYCATGSLNLSRATITFPDVTKEIVVLNRNTGVSEIEVYFHVDSFEMKCVQVYLSSSAQADYTLYASLTGIPSARMYDLTGSGITS